MLNECWAAADQTTASIIGRTESCSQHQGGHHWYSLEFHHLLGPCLVCVIFDRSLFDADCDTSATALLTLQITASPPKVGEGLVEVVLLSHVAIANALPQ
jgi:hypothetical protein